MYVVPRKYIEVFTRIFDNYFEYNDLVHELVHGGPIAAENILTVNSIVNSISIKSANLRMTANTDAYYNYIR